MHKRGFVLVLWQVFFIAIALGILIQYYEAFLLREKQQEQLEACAIKHLFKKYRYGSWSFL